MGMVPALFSHYRRHPLQLMSLVLIIVLATGLWSGVWDLTRQARNSLAQSSRLLADRYQVQREDGAPVTVDDFVTLRRQGICVMPWLEVQRPAPQGRVIGIDPLSLNCLARDHPEQANRVKDELASPAVVDIHKAVTIAARGYDSRFQLWLADPSVQLPSGFRLSSGTSGLDTGDLADSFLLNLNALCVLVLLITALLVRSVYRLGLMQRRDSLSLLRRYGVESARIQRYLVVELLLVTTLSAVPGVLLGRLAARLFAGGFDQVMAGLFDTGLYAGSGGWVSALAALGVVVIVVLWGVADLLLPAYARLVRGRGVIRVSIMAAAVAIGLLMAADTLAWVFAGMVLLFAGVGLLTPRLLGAGLSRGAARSGSPLGQWSLQEMAVMMRQLALPAVALQFAVATVIAVQALVSTFEATFYGWLDQRLQGELYIQVPDNHRFRTVEPILASSDAVADWNTVIRGQARVGTITTDLLAVDPDSALVQAWQFQASVAKPWQALAKDGVMVNEQLARRQSVVVGQRLQLTVAGKDLARTVVGIYPDYGRPVGEIALPRSALPAGFQPDFASLAVALSATPGAGERLQTQLARAWQVDHLEVRDNNRVRELARQVFRQTFVLTRAISLLTLALSAVSLLLMGRVFFAGRLWYYQLLHVWGLSMGAIHRRLQWQAVGLTGLIALSALPLGIFMTWVLVARVNPLAFGWSLPMAVYPLFWLELIGLCAVIGLLIAWLSRRAVGDRPPAPVAVNRLDASER